MRARSAGSALTLTVTGVVVAVALAGSIPAGAVQGSASVERAVATNAPSLVSPARWQLSPGRFGPMRMGASTTTALGRGWIVRNRETGQCAGGDFLANPRKVGDNSGVTTKQARVVEFGFGAGPWTTTRGVRIGMSSEAVLGSYPNARRVRSEYGPYSYFLVVGSRKSGFLDFLVSSTYGQPGFTVQRMSVRAGSQPLVEGDGC